VNGFDIGVVAVVCLSALFAFARGFVREVLSIVAWLGAGLIALYALPHAVPFAENYLPKGWIANTAALLAIFLVALIILVYVTSLIGGRVNQSSLSAVDHTLGLIFGVLRGVLVVCVFYLALTWVFPESREPLPGWIADGKTRPYLKYGAEQLSVLLPAAYREKLESALGDTRRAAGQINGAIGGKPRQPDQPPQHAPSYPPDARRDLDRLIEQQQDR
jgi:membrane protein required for colicin V production